MVSLVEDAFNKIPRRQFLPDEVKDFADINQALPIGYGQTNSQPSLVYDMLNILKLEPGLKVLDVGCGSGWTTALIASIIGPNGIVIGTEIIPELSEFAKNNCNKFALKNLNIINTVKELGYSKQAPYDRILVSANAKDIPENLLSQLSSSSGIMVIPVNNELLVIENNDTKFNINKKYGVIFVPLIDSAEADKR